MRDERRRGASSRRAKTAVAATVLLGALSVSPFAVAGTAKTAKTTSTTQSVTATVDTVATTTGGKLSSKTKSGDKMAKEFNSWNTTRAIMIGEAGYAIGSTGLMLKGYTGAGVDIAVIDTGVAPVPSLDGPGKVVNGPDLSLDFQGGMPVAVDAFGHGTHLASIAANSDNGIAKGARLINMKVGAVDGGVDVSQVIAAVNWAVEHRTADGLNIRVLLLAYGTDSTQGYQQDPLTHAIETAWRNGIVVVASAGNDPAPVTSPATDPNVIAVGAADTNDPYTPDDDTLAPFSATGSRSRSVDLLAPGVSILGLRVPGSTIDQENPDAVVFEKWFKGSGTSQAAAVLAGGVAQLLQARPALTPDQVKFLLTGTARPLSGVKTTAQGAGIVDLSRALDAPTPSIVGAWAPSKGTGSIEASRGSYHLVADDGTILQGEVDLLGAPWNPSWYGPAASGRTTWTGGTWNGNVWAGAEWSTANQVSGSITWDARTWKSTTWTARTWKADTWTARSWKTGTWDGRTWR